MNAAERAKIEGGDLVPLLRACTARKTVMVAAARGVAGARGEEKALCRHFNRLCAGWAAATLLCFAAAMYANWILR